MNKKADGVIEILGGVAAAVVMIAVIALIFSSGSSVVYDEANAKALTALVTELVTAQNVPLSGGEHTTGIWNLEPSKDIVYAIIYMPSTFANYMLTNSYSWDAILSFQSKDELNKCTGPLESCLCLFKTRLKGVTDTIGCKPDSNVITVTSSGASYADEYRAVENWMNDKFNDNSFSQADFLKCVPLAQAGCKFVDENGKTRPCIVHDIGGRPIVWLYTQYISREDIIKIQQQVVPGITQLTRVLGTTPAPLRMESLIMHSKDYAVGGGSYPDIQFIQNVDVPLLLKESIDTNPCK